MNQQFYYSKSLNMFFIQIIDSSGKSVSFAPSSISSLPSDAVAVSDADHAALMQAQEGGKQIVADSNGAPVAVTPTVDAKWARAERDAAISAIWWRIERYQSQQAASITTTDTASTYQALLTYVEELRNWPTTSGFPDVTTMPVAP